jgi:hypothetical protein
MSKYLVYGPAGCGKQVYAEKELLSTISYSRIDCYEIERFDECSRQYFYKQFEQDDEILIVGIDTIPKLWQRGLLTKIEEEYKHKFIVFTARSLSKVDKAFQSRCIGKRLESRYIKHDKMLHSISATDYDIEMDDIPLDIWSEDNNPGDLIRDLLLSKAMGPLEFVKYALDELRETSLEKMECIVRLASTLTNESSWYDLEWWVCAVKKVLKTPTIPPKILPSSRASLNFVHLLHEI